MHATFVEGGLGAGHGDAVVGDVQEKGIVPAPRVLEMPDEDAQALVDTGDRLVVLGDFGAAGWGVREKAGHVHLGRVVDFLDDTGEALARPWVAEAVRLVREFYSLAASTVWVGGANVQKEGFITVFHDEFLAVVGHHLGAAAVSRNGLVELVDMLRSNVVLATASRTVAGRGKVGRKADNVGVAVELVVAVLMTVVAVGMVVQTGQDH